MPNITTWILSSFGEFPNSQIAMFVAHRLLLRSLQLALSELVYIKSITHKSTGYQAYWNDARGAKPMVDVQLLVSFTTSASSTVRDASAHLSLACESQEHLWALNHCGNYISIDGKVFLHVQADFMSGNISVGAAGQGSHVPEEFREHASAAP